MQLAQNAFVVARFNPSLGVKALHGLTLIANLEALFYDSVLLETFLSVSGLRSEIEGPAASCLNSDPLVH